MSVFNSTVQPVPRRSDNMRQVRQCRHLNDTCRFRTEFGLLCGQLCRTAFGTTKERILADRDITDHILKSDCHAHSSEEVDISPRSDSDKEDVTDTSCTLSTYCICSPQPYKGSHWVTTNRLNVSYPEDYSPAGHLAPDVNIMLFDVTVTSKQYIMRKYKRFGIRIYKLCVPKGYMYNMSVYLGKDRRCASSSMTTTHTTARRLTASLENAGHKLYTQNFLSPPTALDSFRTKTINCHETARQNRRAMQKNFRQQMKLNKYDKD
jgi:hypothetical protein